MGILILNAGSSTLKFAIFDDRAAIEICRGLVDWQGDKKNATLTIHLPTGDQLQKQAELQNYGEAVGWILRELALQKVDCMIQAVGHRVVHGGTDFREPVLLDSHIQQSLTQLSRLAPLHHPPVLATFNATRAELPNTPQFAVFDTAFFADLPEFRTVYPVPWAWHEQYGIRRYGFHGISHEYCTGRATELLRGQPGVDGSELRLVICHLGSGCSATAVRGDKPIATTMGFTPLEGLMMGTRSGSIDPGILTYLMQEHGLDAKDFQFSLNRESGLLGVSGISSDFRTVEQAAANGHTRSRLAIDMFTDRVRSTIGSLAVTLGGIDGLVFTAGIGENSASMRRQVGEGLECLGIRLDEEANLAGRAEGSDVDIADVNSTARVLLIRTEEEKMVARQVVTLAKNSPCS